eukprot:1302979-Rhodomonas_salina.4
MRTVFGANFARNSGRIGEEPKSSLFRAESAHRCSPKRGSPSAAVVGGGGREGGRGGERRREGERDGERDGERGVKKRKTSVSFL